MIYSKIKRILIIITIIISTLIITDSSNLKALDNLIMDEQAPSIPTITTNPTYTGDSWTNKATVLTASGSTDNLTASEDIIYEVSLDGATYILGNSISLTQSGNYTVYFKVTDEAGNSATTNKNLKLDLIAPDAPYISLNAGISPYLNNTWVNLPVNIQLYGAVDTGGSELAGYQYKIGEGNWTNKDTYLFNTSGDYLLYFRSMDNAGNFSSTGIRNIKIDLEGPIPFQIQTSVITTDSIQITGSTVDNLSGLAKAAYRVNDGKVWSNWRSAVEDWLTGYKRGQEVTLIVEAKDNAGNVTKSQTTVRTLTNTSPIAVKDSFNTKSNAGKVPLELLKNDYDDDNGDMIRIVEISELSNQLAGKLYLESGKVYFEPTKNFGGSTSFEYIIEDGYGGKDTAIVELVVTAVNEIIKEPEKEERQIVSERIFSDICIIGLVTGAILLLINYIIHRNFFNKRPIRIILLITSAIIVFPLLCILRISMGYVFSFSIMVVFIVTSYLYAAWGASKK